MMKKVLYLLHWRSSLERNSRNIFFKYGGNILAGALKVTENRLEEKIPAEVRVQLR